MTETRTEPPPAPPKDFRLTVPDGWFRIVLDPALWPRQINALVDQQFRGVDSLPTLRRQLCEQLTVQASAAHAKGGIALYLSVRPIGDMALPAGMVATVVPPHSAVPLEEYALTLAAAGESIRLIDTKAGPALCHRYLQNTDPDTAYGAAIPTVHFDVHVAVPATESQLLLSFSSPIAALADMLSELFEAVASTLQWLI